MDLRLTGKKALVTGSTGGIGAEIARVLAQEGAIVAVNGRHERRGKQVVAEINDSGGKAVLALGDVATDEGGDATARVVEAELGHIDILVNNAAGFAGSSSVSTVFTVPPADWGRTCDLNVGPMIRMTQRFVQPMIERGWGRLIHISSLSATMPSGETADYSAAKAAMLNASLSMAKKLANTGVTSNVVSPGMVLTHSLKAWFRAIGEREGWGDDLEKSEAWVLANGSKQLVARIGRVEDIADLVTFVASPRADYINGTNLHVNGGAAVSII
jgi:3-oxoacyl-[acyl-carrier protein] reductase